MPSSGSRPTGRRPGPALQLTIRGGGSRRSGDGACGWPGSVDYISAGPVVPTPTPTKPGRPGTGLDYIREAESAVTLAGLDHRWGRPRPPSAEMIGGRRPPLRGGSRWLTDAADPGATRARQLRGDRRPTASPVPSPWDNRRATSHGLDRLARPTSRWPTWWWVVAAGAVVAGRGRCRGGCRGGRHRGGGRRHHLGPARQGHRRRDWRGSPTWETVRDQLTAEAAGRADG